MLDGAATPWLPAVLVPVAVVIGTLAAIQIHLARGAGQDKITGLTTSATTTSKL
jgi:hypothetical protein